VAPSTGYRHRRLEERQVLFDRVHELEKSGLGVREIASRLSISSRDVSYWLRVNRPSREVYAPDLTPRPELAYLVGAYLGDGRTAGPKDKKVRFKVADLAFANLLNELVAKSLDARIKPLTNEDGYHCISYDAALLYDFLQRPAVELEEIGDSFPAAFLRGMFDAEGYASPRLYHAKAQFTGITVGLANSNIQYLSIAQRLLLALGVRSSFTTTHLRGELMTIRGRTYLRKSEVYHLVIVRMSDVERFHRSVDFAIPDKHEKLQDMVRIVTTMDRCNAYDWFVSHYERRHRRWKKKADVTEI